MKYWRGYLVAAILGFFTWSLMEFAKSNVELVDMFYPYTTRMIQNTLAQWSGTVDVLLWQVLLVLLVVLFMATLILMVMFRWNPIQWAGWILAVASVISLLHTGIYGLNDYAGPMANDIKLNVSEYTIAELRQAAEFYLEQANTLSGTVARDSEGNVKPMELEEMTQQATTGFQKLTYEQHIPIFYGTTIATDDYWGNWEALPIKTLGWEDYFTSIGVTSIYMPITGEIALNTRVPAVAQPFILCTDMAKRLCIAVEGDAQFAAYMACKANEDKLFQYSAAMMAYRSCREALRSLPGNTAAAALEAVESKESRSLRNDLTAYSQFFIENADPENLQRLEDLQIFMEDADYQFRDLFGVEPDNRNPAEFHDLLVNWHIQYVILPTKEPEEEEFRFDPFFEDYINGLVDKEGNPIVPTEEIPEE